MTTRLSTLIVLLIVFGVFVGCSGPDSKRTETSGADAAGSGTSADDAPESVKFTMASPSKSEKTKSDAAPDADAVTETEHVAEPQSAPESTPVLPNGIGESAAGTTIGDWPMWGGNAQRNMVNLTTGVDFNFKPAKSAEEGVNLAWTQQLGSQTYGNPVVADGRVYVGTNNGGEFREKHKGDRGIVLCYSEKDGEFLWQLTREKLAAGRVQDWPEQGICSTPCIEGQRMYVVTNRCELMCVDAEGFHDGENDGPYEEEVDNEELDADIIWSLDMIEELGVFPHNLATSSPLVHNDLILIMTSNGVDESDLEVPAPRAPSFIAVNKNSGQVVWEAGFPSMDSRAPERFANILDGQWSSPALVEISGTTQVVMPGGDGVLYSLNADTGELIWWFDLNPKDTVWVLGGRGTRNSVIATPVVVGTDVFLAVGQDPEHGEGVGHLYRIDASKVGDASPQSPDGSPNPNSGQIWHYGGIDAEGTVTEQSGDMIFRRTLSTVSVSDGRVYAADLSGFLHCIDLETGQRKWTYDTFAAVWGSPMVVDGRVLLGDEDGELVILKAGDELEELDTIQFSGSIYSTPAIANGRLFISDRSRLYAFDIKK